jgi:hypothetical protein
MARAVIPLVKQLERRLVEAEQDMEDFLSSPVADVWPMSYSYSNLRYALNEYKAYRSIEPSLLSRIEAIQAKVAMLEACGWNFEDMPF